MNRFQLGKQIDDAIANVFTPLGFTRLDRTFWTCVKNWRTERIDVVLRKESKGTFFINASVVIPRMPGTRMEFVTLTVVNLPMLSGHLDTAYRYSAGEAELPRIRSDLELARGWFEQFATPSQCLEFMRNDPQRNQDSPASKYCRQYLENVMNKQDLDSH